MSEILHRYTRAVLYSSASTTEIAEAVIEAAKQRADLRGADLRGANLGGADLGGAYLRGAEGIIPKVLQILGTRHDIIVRKYGHISIGCKHEPLEWWEKHWKAVGRKEGYSADEAKEYRVHIEACRRFMERYKLMEEPKETAPESVAPATAPASKDETSRDAKQSGPQGGAR